MTLVGKIKQALHSDKSLGNGTGTDSQTGSGQPESYSSAKATEPTTGPDAYQPLSSSAEGQLGHHQGSRLGGHKAAGSAATGKNNPGSVAQGGHASSGITQGSNSTSGSSSAGPGAFKTGYKDPSSGGKPGYDSQFKDADPIYRDSIQQDDSGYDAKLSASTDSKHWAQARELTLAAEREVAAAELSGKEASKELHAAEQAEKAVRKAQIKHREALEEAEKYRAIAADPNLKEQDLADAQDLYDSRRRALEEAEREARNAESDLAGRQSDLEKLRQHEANFGQRLPGLEDDLAKAQRDRAAAEDDSKNLVLAAKDAEADRSGLASDLTALESQLEGLERTAAAKQQEYIDARNAAQNTATKLDEMKAKLRSMDQELLGARSRAQEAEEHLPAYKEAELRAQRDLDNSQSEWQRLKQLEDEYNRNYTEANDRYQLAHSQHGPASKELQDSHSVLQARQDDLERARSRAASAEGKYRELLSLADRHKQYGDSAAQAAQAHGKKYEALNQEAHIHGEKHAEYWRAAREHGETGSSDATSAIKKLEEKVKDLMNKNEP